MPVCCRCNGSGRCINCSCTKSARPCVNCLPLRKGLCRNQYASNTLSPVPVPSLPAPSALDVNPPLPSNPDNLADTPPSTQLYVPSASSALTTPLLMKPSLTKPSLTTPFLTRYLKPHMSHNQTLPKLPT